ncbi:MAG: META domain-containing protein [Alphaproteobacteria bacterium]|nr:MAG: META domain-containing protein [Alphaproteobacteria bacterium]TMJ40775.1 MAG: META domain-containing protein [Alphaproteobacteria bacterium]
MGRQDTGKSVSRRKLIGFAAAAIVMPSRLALARAKTLRGSVSYVERIALPPDAILEVRLIDVSLADAPATTIAVTRVKTRHRLPIPYRLRFDDARIKPGRSYALHARITVNGRLWFISATRHAAFTGKPDKTDIRVERVTSEKSAASNPSGKWLAESIHGHGVIANLQTVIDIAADGKVTGSGGCNRIAGKAEISGERISFGPMISTKMACAPAIMDQESKFLAALGDARHWQLESQKNKLVLFNANSRPILVLARM